MADRAFTAPEAMEASQDPVMAASETQAAARTRTQFDGAYALYKQDLAAVQAVADASGAADAVASVVGVGGSSAGFFFPQAGAASNAMSNGVTASRTSLAIGPSDQVAECDHGVAAPL